jgi:Uma2 family endonuclease
MSTQNASFYEMVSLLPDYASFISSLVTVIRLRLRIDILGFGSATMRKRKRKKGNEPDGCFYVQMASLIGNRIQLDCETDPPPDIAVEIDVHHDSRSKFPIYAALSVPEIWRYDGRLMRIHHLVQDAAEIEASSYVEQAASSALPMLTAQILTEMIERMRTDGELSALLAFDEWLNSHAASN